MVEIPSHIIEACRRGDAQAFEVLVRATERQTFSLVYRIIGNREDAADVVQDAYLKAWRGIKEFRGDSAVTSWLHRIASNAAIEFLRKRSRLAEPVEPERITDLASVSDTPIEIDPSDVEEALARLPIPHRAVLVMRELYGMSIEEIAEQMKVTTGAAKVRLHRARLRLADELRHTGVVVPINRGKKSS
ncbi:MAG: sigma-70 family RNA polymerase sigma factor [Actinomycetota bacterium]